MSLYQNIFYTKFSEQLCSDEHMIRLMMDIELALAQAQENQSLLPKGTAQKLLDHFKEITIDFEKLKKDIALTGNAAAPLVKQLVAAVKQKDADAAKFIHLGATSQDLVDTANVLKFKEFLALFLSQISELEKSLVRLTKEHKETIMIGRTLMQQARPITFGLKTAGWLQGIRSTKTKLLSIKDQLLTIQLGGAVGSQNQYLTNAVRSSFAENLGLNDGPNWHTQRSNIAFFASLLGVFTGNLAKIANDIILLSQTEIGEVSEPTIPGRGTSSTLPHKKNPVLSTCILANAHRLPFLVASILAAMPHTHERAAGRWHSEWETMDDLLGLSAGALEKSIELVEGLVVDKKKMLHNIEVTNGLIFAETVALALAKTKGKQEAHDIIKIACQKTIKEGIPLRSILEEMNLPFSTQDLDYFFEPKNALGFSREIIDEILADI